MRHWEWDDYGQLDQMVRELASWIDECEMKSRDKKMMGGDGDGREVDLV